MSDWLRAWRVGVPLLLGLSHYRSSTEQQNSGNEKTKAIGMITVMVGTNNNSLRVPWMAMVKKVAMLYPL